MRTHESGHLAWQNRNTPHKQQNQGLRRIYRDKHRGRSQNYRAALGM